MVSRNKAFGCAAENVGRSVRWYLIGLVATALFIMLAGGKVIFSLLRQPSGFRSSTILLAMIEHVVIVVGIGFAVGCVISSFGVMATMLKYSAELNADEIRGENDVTFLRTITLSRTIGARYVEPSLSRGSENKVDGVYRENWGRRLGDDSQG
jgi:hypothetical protein